MRESVPIILQSYIREFHVITVPIKFKKKKRITDTYTYTFSSKLFVTCGETMNKQKMQNRELVLCENLMTVEGTVVEA